MTTNFEHLANLEYQLMANMLLSVWLKDLKLPIITLITHTDQWMKLLVAEY